MSVNVPAEDLSAAKVGTTGTISWVGAVQTGAPVGVRQGRPVLRLFNESGCGLAYTIGVSSGRLPAGGWLDMQLNGETELSYLVEYVLAGQPVSLLLGTIYEAGEAIPPLPQLGNSPIGVGGTVSTSTGNSLQNDGNAPGTPIIEATPSDQAASSISLANDASGFLKVLSAGVLRTILNVVRGNATTGKSAVQLGDAGDTSVTTFYGTVGAGSVVPASTVGAGYPASEIGAGTLPAGVTVPAAQVSPGTFGAGEFIIARAGVAGQTDDLLGLSRTVDTPNTYFAGIDKFGNFYIFDSARNAFVLAGAGSTTNSAVQGLIPTMRTNGGGANGAVLWEGTTDPGTNSAEGDWWAPA